MQTLLQDNTEFTVACADKNYFKKTDGVFIFGRSPKN